MTADRADVITDWLKSIKPSGCTSMLDAIKVTHLTGHRHGYINILLLI